MAYWFRLKFWSEHHLLPLQNWHLPYTLPYKCSSKTPKSITAERHGHSPLLWFASVSYKGPWVKLSVNNLWEEVETLSACLSLSASLSLSLPLFCSFIVAMSFAAAFAIYSCHNGMPYHRPKSNVVNRS